MKRRTALLWSILATSGLGGLRSVEAHDGPDGASRPGRASGGSRHRDSLPPLSPSPKSLEDASHRLDAAAEALLKGLMETEPDKRAGGEDAADADLMTLMAAASLQGQARVFHELVEGENVDLNFQLAVRELDLQMSLVDQRLRRRGLTRDQREQLGRAEAAMDDLLRNFRRSGDRRQPPHAEDRYDR